MDMKNEKWNRAFPEVPDHVHQTVLSTLAGLDERKGKRVKRMRKRKAIILIAAAIAILGTTVSAAEIFKWNRRAAEVFVADEVQQDKLVTEQITQDARQTVTDAGLTIEAVQTIQDNNCFYALFQITAKDESIQITQDHSMSFQFDFQDGESPFGALGWHFVDKESQTVSNSRYFEITGIKTRPQSEDLHMKIQFTSLNAPGAKAMDGEPVLKGNWEFVLDLHPIEPVRFDLNREYQIEGHPVTVKTVELTPISVKLSIDEEDARQLEQWEGVNLDQTDSLSSLCINAIKYQDGTVIAEEGYPELQISCGDGLYTKTAKFTNVIDVDKVSALLLGPDMNDEIPLP